MSLQESSYAKSVEKPSFFGRIRAEWLIIGAAVLIVGWLALVPLVFLLWQSFMTPAAGDVPAAFTLGNYVRALTDSSILPLFKNSVVFATGTSCLALGSATPGRVRRAAPEAAPAPCRCGDRNEIDRT